MVGSPEKIFRFLWQQDKNKLFEVMEIINSLELKAPLRVGDIVLKDVLSLGADIIVTKDID